ncbi:Uncharacterized protein BP5553_00816 [Venustampulla echinocandica]|uniref:PH domain-containing protein n=1 Tax=Venustampulla echinocandica TaxID=2656787 RepID=A0A370TZ86_9HELO|nr:Uncharacterized protein BP5553_00816 [Venustampulla echinocandica]RDL40837.1 Uncharacterized protein BP5553_00816 [Venustampulla echinocandica]
MATSLATDHPSLASQDSDGQEQDPFLSSSTSSNPHRFSHFDNQLFALSPAASPDQAKRALEAHLAETERRIQDASKLGTTLVQQRKELAERLKDVEKQQSEGDITPELRQKLVEIEREYNEHASPSKFESQATSSPTKLSVPSRKQRNQPSNRVHDIEFATEISTSLLSQVRHLQALLAEKEDLLKAVTLERSNLEIEREGLTERLRELDESEQRYKDENWNLETQVHELLATTKEAADREQKLTQNLQVVQAEKSAAQKELDEIKLSHAKLSEEHVSGLKHHDVELGSVKRSMIVAENERGALQRKVDELIGQNQELARAVAERRGRTDEQEQTRGLTDEDFETARDDITPEHSPPPSPIKGTPRHSMLETETLKSSLHHAHRMIQNLKGNIHREKTEKLELKRMLQDARDELETRRNDGGLGSANGKRNRKVDSREFKKPLKPGQLGGLRNSRSEVFVDDPDWEEDNGNISPSRSAAANAARVATAAASVPSSSEQFDTANETSDAAFETANERGTETEDFQTGAEDLSGSDELTETEEAASGTTRNRPAPLALQKPGNRHSFQSTASTSGDEYSYEEAKTPTAQPQPQRLRLKVSRGGNRRSRVASEEPQFQSSPASFANSSRNGTPQAAGQSLFAELGDMGGSDEDESLLGTPSRSVAHSQSGTPAASRPNTAKNTPAPPTSLPPVPKIPMVDSGMVTEPWEPEPTTPQAAVPSLAIGAIAGTAATKAAEMISDKHSSTGTQVRAETSDAASQWHDEQLNNFLQVGSQESARPVSTSTYSDNGSQYDPVVMDEKLSRFPSPPTSGAETPRATPPTVSSRLTMSSIYSEDVEPESPRSSFAAPLAMSTIYSEHVEPESPRSIPTARLTMSSIYSEYVEPESPKLNPTAPLAMSTIYSEHVEPIEPEVPATPEPKQIRPSTPNVKPMPAPLVFSSIQSVNTEPIEPLSPRSPRRDAIIIPRDDPEAQSIVKADDPETPKSGFLGSVFSWNKKAPGAMAIAEDETRQSPSDSPRIETPESQRPFKELSNNTNERAAKSHRIETTDESSQTALTAEQIDEMLRNKRQSAIRAEDGQKSPVSPRATGVPLALRPRKSQDSVGSTVRARPSSSRNGSISSIHPPLPADSKQVIAAAAQRTGSSSGGQGTIGASAQRSDSSAGGPGSMGPPPPPALANRNNSSFRPRTPSQIPKSPLLRDGTTPRPMHSSNGPRLQSPAGTGRSRASSVSSFASELDTRFNIRPGMAVPQGVEPGTDPRMINAITQTMIGEYLWKYTRKAGRGTMSEKRHRRYFWVHPYTRTLYWSDHPSQAGKTGMAKSVSIDAVRVVTDDNPMPPGLHRKSLIIVTSGRTVKFTATTGQRHETWFNALSYLLLRTGEEAVGDTGSIAQGALTREDVAEFNPGYGNSSTRRGPTSLSSYNSRTTRNDSPSRKSSQASASRPPLHASTSSRMSMGTLSRLTNYWKPAKDVALGTSKSRHSIGRNSASIYEASEVHDSAEDLREMIEKQDRESDRLENVRACCDGKHDVGHLHSSTKSRHSYGNRAPSRTSVRRGD